MQQDLQVTAAVTNGEVRSVFTFGDGRAEGHAGMIGVLGNKGAGLAEMAALGLPVPPGFTIKAETVKQLAGSAAPPGLHDEVTRGLAHVERIAARRLGDTDGMPLLLSVRSGSTASMPGMMDTVLDLGLNARTVEALAAASGDRDFAYDAYRRFIRMYATLVLKIEARVLDAVDDEEASAEDVAASYLSALEAVGHAIPDDVHEQLWSAIHAVARSWDNERAKSYRHIHRIPSTLGTAVTVQAMVFGNLSESSATGVAFTRDPSTGERLVFGEYLPKAQGEDVVGGARTPYDLTEAARHRGGGSRSLERAMPQAYADLVEVCNVLERHFHDAQEIEFTIENGRLWLLQTRRAKRSSRAMMRMAVDMAREGLISEGEAVLRIEPSSIDQILQPVLDPKSDAVRIMRGLPASPGAATGVIALDAQAVTEARDRGEAAILVRVETSPEDIQGMSAAAGILTAHGGMTSHAAVVARGMSKPCITSAGAMRIDMSAREVVLPGFVLKEGEAITIDGASGVVMKGRVDMIQPSLPPEFTRVMSWADRHRRMRVMANVDAVADARTARACGAEGIGLCRTETLFFRPGRVEPMRKLILSDDSVEKAEAAGRLISVQREELREIFEVMAGLPVTLRLLDMPLHSFLPQSDIDAEDASARRKRLVLQEQSPALGQRGPRMLLAHPRIVAIQVQAALLAVRDMVEARRKPIDLRFMVPFVISAQEIVAMKRRIGQAARAVDAAAAYRVGALIETPRACLVAGELAKVSDFLSFGTNDLTQLVMGLGREESAPFLTRYRNAGLLAADPFQALDVAGVGALMRMACDLAREVRPEIEITVCGEHAADPDSTTQFESFGVDILSCTSFRVPMTRLAATQCHLRSVPRPQPASVASTAHDVA